jgi:hypothetical protein
MYSFQALTKINIETVETPEYEIGMMTLKKPSKRLQPSIMAASSISLGTVSKKLFRRRIEKASPDDA